MKKNIKWFLVTVLAGMVPILLRLVFFFFLNETENESATFQPVRLSDIIAWGLIASISIFHERNDLFKYNAAISTFSTYGSLGIICFCILMYTFGMVNEASLISGNKLLFKEHLLLLTGGIFCFGLTFVACILCCIFSQDEKYTAPTKAAEQ